MCVCVCVTQRGTVLECKEIGILDENDGNSEGVRRDTGGESKEGEA